MTNNATAIDIRKALRNAGLRPSDFDEKAIYKECQKHSISDWEIEGQILPGIDKFRKVTVTIIPWVPETLEEFAARKANNERVLNELHKSGELPPHTF